MDPLHYARGQMGLSLAFHIVFAAAGIALPLLMVVSDLLYRRTANDAYLRLSVELAKGTSILFAVGAVSGTVLSFELGLLWPSFMGRFGAAVGLPFALEGFAFFTEAIFLALYLYGRDRLPKALHLASGVVVALSGAASAFFVTLVNAFMNLPAGVTVAPSGELLVDPWAAMWSPAWRTQTVHVLLSAYEATAFLMVGIHALMLLRQPNSPLHRRALAIALGLGCTTALLQPLSGDRSAKQVAHLQPAKLAALESQFTTERGAPLRLGGWPDEAARSVSYAIEIPSGLSLLGYGDPAAEVRGLSAFPRDEWPPVKATHLAFQVMVGAGSALALFALGVLLHLAVRRRLPSGRGFLRACVGLAPLGVVALEAGWLVTELGRQPWIVHGLLRTQDAVTPFPYLSAPFWIFTWVYLLLGGVVVWLLVRRVLGTAEPKAATS